MTQISPWSGRLGDEQMVVVRAACGDDLDALREFGHEAVPAAYAGVIEPELVDLLLAKRWTGEALAPAIAAGRTMVAYEADRLVGVCTVGMHEGALVVWKLYVRPGDHGRGIGSALLAVARERADRAQVRLRLTFTEGNRYADAFCRRHGFVEVGREEQAGMPDLVWMAEEGA
ncbi:hypothetical protein KEM60_02727 [Austwickia sp. TVS 96-490-7B]|uniref:GNAT family N-acetyltransferase n=1 Tax=Austwickia sp. TVS 96-490-7B TaxID=2830843 RepID=UPI001C5736E2|nr:GNAT family N-acetyltransferase [Austwickia sp. TVS 96-490-7B]MBW3086506.1 hypothetical protein [Austwickia sp. TVS 96-490-7B]